MKACSEATPPCDPTCTPTGGQTCIKYTLRSNSAVSSILWNIPECYRISSNATSKVKLSVCQYVTFTWLKTCVSTFQKEHKHFTSRLSWMPCFLPYTCLPYLFLFFYWISLVPRVLFAPYLFLCLFIRWLNNFGDFYWILTGLFMN